MNNVSLIGRLTYDPELKSTSNGVNKCSFSIAVRRKYQNANGEYEADFINCTAWRQSAEFVCKYFSKGQQIGVSGSLNTYKWDDNGTTRYGYDITVDNVTFVGNKKTDENINTKNDNNTDVSKKDNTDTLPDGGDFMQGVIKDDNLPF